MSCRVRALLFSIAAAIGLVACGSSATTSTNVTAPSTTRCQLSLTNTSQSFGPSGGTGQITVSVARECNWSSSTAANWIEFTTATDGQGDGTIGYRVKTNDDPVSRKGAIAVADQHADVSQDAAPCRYDVSAPTAAVSGAGGDMTVNMRTHVLCGWTVATPVTWITANPASGKGDAEIHLIAQPNTGVERDATVTVGSQPIPVRQLSAPAPGPAPPAPAPTPAPTPTPTPPAPPAPTPTPTPGPGPAPPSPTPEPGPTPAPPPPPPPPPPPAPQTVTITGRVDHVQGKCPSVTFDVKVEQDTAAATTWRVSVDDKTKYTRGSCKDLPDARTATATGVTSDGRTLTAQTIEVRK